MLSMRSPEGIPLRFGSRWRKQIKFETAASNQELARIYSYVRPSVTGGQGTKPQVTMAAGAPNGRCYLPYRKLATVTGITRLP